MAQIRFYTGSKGKPQNKALIGLACLVSIKMKQPVIIGFMEHLKKEQLHEVTS